MKLTIPHMNNLNLINKKLLKNTKPYYELKKYSIVHQAISLVISQKISFQQGKNIRKELFYLINPDLEFTKENIKNIKDENLENIGIDVLKIKTIRNILKLDDTDNNDFIEKIGNIKGIGPWTIKCLKIYFELDNDIFLSEDLWIRKRVTELTENDTVLTQKECENASKNWSGYRTQVSKFFWRIKPSGITALLNNDELNYDHFL